MQSTKGGDSISLSQSAKCLEGKGDRKSPSDSSAFSKLKGDMVASEPLLGHHATYLTVGSFWLICITYWSHTGSLKYPEMQGAVRERKKSNDRRSSTVENEFAHKAMGMLRGQLSFTGGESSNRYPSHFLPVLVQRLQDGFASSHLTLRILTDN